MLCRLITVSSFQKNRFGEIVNSGSKSNSKVQSTLNKWLTMAKVEKSFEAVCDFMALDQFFEACSRELFVHLKPKAFENLDAMAKEADLFAEARGAGVFSCVNKGQRDNNKGAVQSKPEK